MNERTFQALCRNDAAVTFARATYPFCSPYSLDTALDGNTHVRHLELYWDPLVADATAPVEEHARLQAYIRQAQSLRTVDFFIERQGHDLGEWMEAVAASTSITEFGLLTHHYASAFDSSVTNTLVRLLQTTPSIKTLKLELGDHVVEVCDSLRATTTLESLSVDSASTQSVQTVLDALRGHGSIRSFSLALAVTPTASLPFAVSDSLLFLLQASSALTDMSLQKFYFDDIAMEQLLNGLRSNRSISTLGLIYCYFSAAAEVAFVTYMQQRNGRDLGEGGLKSLQMEYCQTENPQDPDNVDFLSSLLKGPRSSGLTSATLAHASFDGFWEALEDDRVPQSATLLRLKLKQPFGADLEEKICHIPNLLYLRSLEWCLGSEVRNTRLLLDAIRKNGSLHNVSVRRWESEEIWNPKQERLVKAWGERNRHLPDLLEKCGAKKNPTSEVHDQETQGYDACPTSGASLTTTLFATALTTPRMTLHHFFHGITALGDDLMGHHRDS